MIKVLGSSAIIPRSVRRLAICSVYGAALFLGGCGAGKETKGAPIEQRSKDIAPAAVQVAGSTQTHVEMVNVNIHLDPALILHIHYLSGQFLPTRKGQPPAFDDKLSYVVAIDSAEVGVSASSMSHALNTYVFSAPDAPLKNLTLSIQGNQIKQTGTLNKGIGIPFEMTGTMSATANGRIRIQPTQMKAAHLPVKGVMKLLGLDMAKLVNTRRTKGVSVEGNDIISYSIRPRCYRLPRCVAVSLPLAFRATRSSKHSERRENCEPEGSPAAITWRIAAACCGLAN
jgi:hypothetical protein